MEIICEISEIDCINEDNVYEKLLTSLNEMIDPMIKQQLSSNIIRRKMSETHGSKCFLLPDQLKLPICNPKTGEIDDKVLQHSYIRAKQMAGRSPGYREAALKAKELLQSRSKFGVRLENSEVTSIENFLNIIEVNSCF